MPLLQQSEVPELHVITLMDHTRKGELNSTVSTTLFALFHLFSLSVVEARNSKGNYFPSSAARTAFWEADPENIKNGEEHVNHDGK